MATYAPSYAAAPTSAPDMHHRAGGVGYAHPQAAAHAAAYPPRSAGCGSYKDGTSAAVWAIVIIFIILIIIALVYAFCCCGSGRRGGNCGSNNGDNCGGGGSRC